jgi:hypothetical protein
MQPYLPSDSKATSLTIDTIISRYHELVSPLVAAYLAGCHKDLNWSRYHALVVIEKQLHHIKSKKDTAQHVITVLDYLVRFKKDHFIDWLCELLTQALEQGEPASQVSHCQPASASLVMKYTS